VTILEYGRARDAPVECTQHTNQQSHYELGAATFTPSNEQVVSDMNVPGPSPVSITLSPSKVGGVSLSAVLLNSTNFVYSSLAS